MRDIPVFTTENGAAGLILKEIPYKEAAYIHIHSSQNPDELIKECAGFCRVCGAKNIYVKDYGAEFEYPIHTVVWEMRGKISFDPDSLLPLFPVTEHTVSEWRSIYNTAMRNVDNAATLETRDEKEILSSGGAYFLHQDEQIVGIGWLDGAEIRAVVSLIHGKGADICRTLQSIYPDETMTLQVASTNTRAVHLYEKLGLIRVRELSRWYEVL